MTPTLCMLDLSHNDSIPTKRYSDDLLVFQQINMGGYPFLIHKATQGIDFIDPRLLGRMMYAGQAGLDLGIYHYMDMSPVAAQVAYFLMAYRKVSEYAGGKFVLALDFEYTQGMADAASTMFADDFVQAIHAATGIWPLLYTGRWDVLPQVKGSCLAACPLWLAEYGDNPVPPKGWANFTWWQKYGDGLNNAPTVPVLGNSIDQSLFAGSLNEAKAWWAANAI